jgi:putative copper export protein
MLLRLMSLIAPPPNSGALTRVRGFAILILLVVLLVAIGFGVAKLIALPFGGVGVLGGLLLGLLIVAAVLGGLALVGRRRQDKARAAQRERVEAAQPRRTIRR